MMLGRSALCFAVALFGCRPPEWQAPDDPKTCLVQAKTAEDVWRESVQKKLDEKLPSLGHCASEGGLTREERFFLNTSFSPDGAWQPPTRAVTTLPNCGVIECVQAELSAVRADVCRDKEPREVPFEFFLSPSSPPRHARPDEAPFPFGNAKHCAGEVPPGVVTARLPPEVIQHVVRSHYPEIRACYEEGLYRNSQLTGRITARFVIGRDGRVNNLTIFENTLPDCEVVHCVGDHFQKLQFPPPKGGIVTVVYPIMLEPAE